MDNGATSRGDRALMHVKRPGLGFSRTCMEPDSTLARELRHHHLFSALTGAQREQVLAHAHVRAFTAGEHLFSQGDAATSFFLLRQGSIKLYRLSPEGHEKIMRFIR
ncbi:MAG: cyclic nucleotide-binding domain-containing protein, partial [Gammaproteobacteria bacterium]